MYQLIRQPFCSFGLSFTTGKGIREDIVRFALSPEETGRVITQLPNNPIEIVRSGESSKAFRITPKEGGAAFFELDMEVNGIGGQFQSGEMNLSAGPFQVLAQRGEIVVMRKLMQTSIPSLVGWTSMMNVAVKNRIEESRGGGGGYNN